MADPVLDPYQPPRSDDPPRPAADVDDLVGSTRASPRVITAAGLVAGTGAVLALAAVQLWANVQLLGAYEAIPWVMLALGGTLAFVGAKLYRLRLWAAQVGIALCILTALAAGIWFLLSFASGLFTLYALMLPPLGAAGTVLCILSLPAARTATLARAQLAHDGLDTDF